MRLNLPTSDSYLPSFLNGILYLPIETAQKDIQPLIFETSEGRILPVFSSELVMTEFFESVVQFTEFSSHAVLAMAREQNLTLGFDLGMAHQVLFDQSDILELEDLLRRRELLISKPNLQFRRFLPPEDLMNALSEKLPQSGVTYLVNEAQEGLLLMVEIDPKVTSDDLVFQMRQALMQLDETDTIGLVAIPKGHEKWSVMERDLHEFGHVIERRADEKIKRPPILR